MTDPLYSLFEHCLFNALVEDENTDDFLTRVVASYLEQLHSEGTIIPHHHKESIETDLREEVLEMFRKKTYGHFNLTEYRKAKGVAAQPIAPPPAQKEKARRKSRAC